LFLTQAVYFDDLFGREPMCLLQLSQIESVRTGTGDAAGVAGGKVLLGVEFRAEAWFCSFGQQMPGLFHPLVGRREFLR
jgi:hypothetical protein